MRGSNNDNTIITFIMEFLLQDNIRIIFLSTQKNKFIDSRIRGNDIIKIPACAGMTKKE